jgi:hypothetical protein
MYINGPQLSALMVWTAQGRGELVHLKVPLLCFSNTLRFLSMPTASAIALLIESSPMIHQVCDSFPVLYSGQLKPPISSVHRSR